MTTPRIEESWKAELRKEYRKQTLAMAREVSASGTYEKVEGMICDWWLEKIDHQLQKARQDGYKQGCIQGKEEERQRIISLAGGEPYLYVPKITEKNSDVK